jgi:hypothetical protein
MQIVNQLRDMLGDRLAAARILASQKQMEIVSTERANSMAEWVFENYNYGPGGVRMNPTAWERTDKPETGTIVMSREAIFGDTRTGGYQGTFTVELDKSGNPKAAQAIKHEHRTTGVSNIPFGQSPDFKMVSGIRSLDLLNTIHAPRTQPTATAAFIADAALENTEFSEGVVLTAIDADWKSEAKFGNFSLSKNATFSVTKDGETRSVSGIYKIDFEADGTPYSAWSRAGRTVPSQHFAGSEFNDLTAEHSAAPKPKGL